MSIKRKVPTLLEWILWKRQYDLGKINLMTPLEIIEITSNYTDYIIKQLEKPKAKTNK